MFKKSDEVIELLLAAGANINAMNDLNKTPLMLTKMYGDAGIKSRKILQENLKEAAVRDYRVNTLLDKMFDDEEDSIFEDDR